MLVELVGNNVDMIVRNIVKDRNIVIENDIFFLVFIGIKNIRMFR